MPYFLNSVAQQLEPAAVVHPGFCWRVLRPNGEPGIEGEGRVLADDRTTSACGRTRRCRSASRRTPAARGTISPPAKTLDLELACRSAGRRAWHMASAEPWIVSRLFGQLVASRQRTVGAGLRDGGAGDGAGCAARRPPGGTCAVSCTSPFGCDDAHGDWRSCLFLRGGRGTRQRPGKLCSYTD